MRRVVITGMGAVTPIGNTVPEFWNSLIAGQCGIDFITKFDTEAMTVKIAAEVKNFDPTVYIPRDQVRKTDLFTQYALYAAAQAMEQSGLTDTNINPERLGVYVGSGVGGVDTLLKEADKLFTRGPSRVSPFCVPSSIANVAAGNVAIRFNAQGPCLSIVTACATSTHCIGEAFRSIKHGYADAIIAGGTEATIIPLCVAGFTNCMALTRRNDPKTACVPFDKRRDGFVLGEGAGIVVLEEYQHAVDRGATILAEVCGYSNTCDAYHITAPDAEAAGSSRAIAQAIAEAGWENPCDGGLYINAHGTSTPMNDKIETLAIKRALGEHALSAQISSTKSMTGHTLGAAGAIEAVASVLALQNGILPPTIGYAEQDPDCDLDYIPNQARACAVDHALSVSLGFGGHNACLAFKRAN